MKVQQTSNLSSKAASGPSPQNIAVSKDDVNLPKINTKKQSKRIASVDDDDEDFERDQKGIKTGKSQADLVHGKDIGKKRLISQSSN